MASVPVALPFALIVMLLIAPTTGCAPIFVVVATGMTASSPVVGTWEQSQFAAVFQPFVPSPVVC